MSYFTFQLKFEENISNFFPDTQNEQNLNIVFNNLKVKDKIIVMISSKDSIPDENILIENANLFADSLTNKIGDTYIKNILLRIDDSLKYEIQNFIYDNLPIFLTDSDYIRIDSLYQQENMDAMMQKNYSNLLSPVGGVLREYVMKDPLGIGGNALKRLQDFQLDRELEQIDGYIFTKDGTVLLMFITPTYSMGSTGKNDLLITKIENTIASFQQNQPSINIEYYGGPSVGVYNARQIKKDSIFTGIIALTIIIAFISLAFKEKKTIPLVITPTLFGGLFSLCIIYFLKGSISSIAVGSGSVILGIALSYSIHMIVHQKHVATVQQLIIELTYPLTVGSFTTIGAFLGLLFTSSELLRDFGLFASMTLIGTTLFCLIYLPHFLKGEINEKKGALLQFIEKFNSYRFDKNKWLVGAIIIITIICAFTSQRVGFDADMMNVNYEPPHLKKAEQKLLEITEKNKKTVLLVSVGKNASEGAENYNHTNQKLVQLKSKGLIKDFASADYFSIPDNIQKSRLEKWNNYWTPDKKAAIKSSLESESSKYNFRLGIFNQFYMWLDKDFLGFNNSLESNKILSDWINKTPALYMFISQIQLDESNKDEVYSHFTDANKVIVFDRAFFMKKWISAVNDDFYLVLFISSFLIFFTLLLSYGRIELALISFLPMFVSWIIIIGIMGMIGMHFNIVNIILSTFIFGIGDDFSIFIMDGLQNKYKTKHSTLNGHKTAIFFAAFTTIVGMGSLVFAQHPALQSISIMSILGMLIVVFVSYTIPPAVFRWLISSQTIKGFPPYTFASIITSFCVYISFIVGCIFLRTTIFLLYVVPINKLQKRKFVCYLITLTCRCICKITFIVKKEQICISKDIFKKPSIIIANHQSFTDILFLLSLTPKAVMVTNHWVWNSPLFGDIIRYAGYFFVGEGFELSSDSINKRLDEGFSIIIFPEGTRSRDGKIKRFHKGAFYYAEKLNVDIIPIILYGTGLIISKAQPFYLKRGNVVIKALPNIENNDYSLGKTYREKTKNVAVYFKNEYAKVLEKYNNPNKNSFFYHTLIKNYIYKGPVEEWYMRIKLKMEKSYQFFDNIIPEQAIVTDIGCGYGALCYMLKLISSERKIFGVDYDEDKIKVAQNCFLKDNNIQFDFADALNYNLPESDVFVMNDILHYMNWNDQKVLIKKCVAQLKPEGIIIIRDGNIDDVKKQKITKLTEIFSTKILGFNKTKEKLCFISSEMIYNIAKECKMTVASLKNDKFTSNTIFILKRNNING